MKLKNLAIAVLVANLFVTFPVTAHAQIFNKSGSSTAATPVFIPKPQVASTGNVFNNTGTTSRKASTKPMTDGEYQQMVAANQRQRDALYEQQKSQFAAAAASANAETTRQINAQAQARMAAAQQAGVAAGGPAVAPGQVVDPYAGRTVVFTGAKKTDDKPVRLFNVQ